jgi:hypothetical protein
MRLILLVFISSMQSTKLDVTRKVAASVIREYDSECKKSIDRSSAMGIGVQQCYGGGVEADT